MLKTAVVIGGGSGIGKRTAERLCEAGWAVWSLDISAPSGAVSPPGGEGELRHLRCDAADPACVDEAFAQIAGHHASVDALIFSAGVIRIGALEDLPLDDIDLMLKVNVRAPMLAVKRALPLLRRAVSPDRPSRIVLLGSIGGIRPKIGSGFYSATKAALHTLTGVLAVELAPSGVLVNAVAPGTVATPMVENLLAGGNTSGYRPSGESPLGRVAVADDIADAILLLLSDAAKYVNGVVLPVDGGTRAAYVPR